MAMYTVLACAVGIFHICGTVTDGNGIKMSVISLDSDGTIFQKRIGAEEFSVGRDDKLFPGIVSEGK